MAPAGIVSEDGFPGLAFAQTGFGDDEYPVHALRDQTGDLAGVEVAFLDRAAPELAVLEIVAEG